MGVKVGVAVGVRVGVPVGGGVLVVVGVRLGAAVRVGRRVLVAATVLVVRGVLPPRLACDRNQPPAASRAKKRIMIADSRMSCVLSDWPMVPSLLYG